MKAFSADSGKEYDSWDDLVAAETNGYVVVLQTTRPDTGPAVYGPFASREDAVKKQRFLRRRAIREDVDLHGFPRFIIRTNVRLLWKADL